MGDVSPLENVVCAIDLTNLTGELHSGPKCQVRVPVTFKRGFDGSKEIHSSLSDPNGRVFFRVNQR
jgi:hypothetical protein